MPDFRRGTAEIRAAVEEAETRGSGSFTPWMPKIFWGKPGDTDNAGDPTDVKHILFLNDAEDIPRVQLISFVPTSERDDGKPVYSEFIARTDPAIGERKDKLVDENGAKPKDTNIAIAVELVPVLEENDKGRLRPVGFEVKTSTFERKARDEDGKAIDGETEEVVQPVIGAVQQSPSNFFNWVGSYAENDAPIQDTPVKVTRTGKGTNTAYAFTPYEDMPVDLTGLLDNLEAIGYLSDQVEEVYTAIEKLEDKDAAMFVANVLLDKWLEELADGDRYDKLAVPCEEWLDKWGNSKGKSSSKSGEKKTNTRSAKTSQRRSRRQADEPVDTGEGDSQGDAVSGSEPEATAEEKPKGRRSRQGNPEAMAQLEALRSRSSRGAKASA